MILPLCLDRILFGTAFFSREVDALQLGIYQLAFACVYSTIGTFLFETLVLPHSSIQWFAILRL